MPILRAKLAIVTLTVMKIVVVAVVLAVAGCSATDDPSDQDATWNPPATSTAASERSSERCDITDYDAFADAQRSGADRR